MCNYGSAAGKARKAAKGSSSWGNNFLIFFFFFFPPKFGEREMRKIWQFLARMSSIWEYCVCIYFFLSDDKNLLILSDS